MLLPVVVIKARKFALLFSMGSISALVSVAMLRGPSTFFAYMFSKERAVLSAAYVLSLVLTLYCAMGSVAPCVSIFLYFILIAPSCHASHHGSIPSHRLLTPVWCHLSVAARRHGNRLRKTIPTVFCATFQMLVLGRFLLGYIPGGTYGAKMLGKLWFKTMTTVVFPMLKKCLPWCAGV
jgi:hypothetical protein